MVARAGGADELRIDGESEGISLAHVPLGDVSALLDRLALGAGSVAYRTPLDAARRAYGKGRTIGGAYVELLRAILEPLGIGVLDAAHPSVRRAAAPLHRRALHVAAAVSEAVAVRDRELSSAGHDPQVIGVEGMSLVFVSEGGHRQRVKTVDARRTADTAADEALSPNVLLRPVVERSILPTVAYVAGPAELAYFAQTSAVAAALAVPAPLAVPRWSCTIVEPRVDEILRRLGLRAEQLRDPHAAEARIAHAQLPRPITDAMARMRAAVDDGITRLSQDGAHLVPPRAIEGAARSILYRTDRLERRFVAAMKRRMSDVLQDVGTARGSLYPDGKRQERALNLLPMLARHGPVLLERMYAAAHEHAGHLLGRADAPTGAVAREAPGVASPPEPT